MSIAFLYALAFLVIVPPMFGGESLGILGIIVGSILSWIIIGIAKTVETTKKQDYEILGTYITAARYYEPWVEKIKHEDEESGEITYEEVVHYEEWEATVAEGDTFLISESEYRRYVSLFDNEREEEIHHEYEAKGEIIEDGSCYVTIWPGTYETAVYKYVERSYKNAILGAPNVYEKEKLSKEEIREHHLKSYDYQSLYGTVRNDDTKKLENELDDYNCWSRTKNIKLNFIVLKNAKSTEAMYWEQYWQNGKRNTINAVVGINGRNKIEWAHVFGWQNEAACIKLRNFITGLKKFSDIPNKFNEIEKILKNNYKVPNFREYDFVQSRFPLKGTIIALSICLGIFCLLFGRPPQYNARAYEHLERGEYQAAKTNFQEFLSQKPNDVHVLNNLAILYFKEGNYDEAEKLFNRALEDTSWDETQYVELNLGLYYKKRKQNKNAIATLKKAIHSSSYDNRIKTYCPLYYLYKDLGYRNSMKKLQKEYDFYSTIELKNDCKNNEEEFYFFSDTTTPIDNRGFVRLLGWLFNKGLNSLYD